VDLGDGHALRRLSHLHDLVARLDLAFLEYAKIEPRSPARGQQRWHPRLVHANAHAVAGDARLCHFEERAADAITVADADAIVGQPFEREVFAELAVDEVFSLQLRLPVAIRFDLVDEDRALLAAVSREVALTVAVEVQSARVAAAA